MNGNDHSFLFSDQTRWCAHHWGKASADGGKWLVSNHGRSRRWICAACSERRRVSQKKELVAA